MPNIPEIVQNLIDAFARFPGIGKKSAQRMTYFIMNENRKKMTELASGIVRVKDEISECHSCHMLTDKQPCTICTDHKRNESIICIVEESSDVYAIERTNAFFGKYHVLGGVLSPLEGVGPDALNIVSLIARIHNISEVIIATNASHEGDATAMYLFKKMEEKNIKITRLARGVPSGSHMEYLDEETLRRAITERVNG